MELTKTYLFQIFEEVDYECLEHGKRKISEEHILICEEDFWNTNHYINDEFDEELNEFMESIGFLELMDICFENSNNLSYEEIRQLLSSYGMKETVFEFIDDEEE